MGLEYGKLSNFFDGWDHVISEVQDAKRLAVNEMGKAVMVEVQDQIARQGVQDTQYHVRNWQRYTVGSKFGYAAVTPMSVPLERHGKPLMYNGKPVTSRKVTKWLDHGHGARRPSGRWEGYRPRLAKTGISRSGMAFVKGFQFYSWARMKAEEIAMRAAEKVLVKLENAFDL